MNATMKADQNQKSGRHNSSSPEEMRRAVMER
jgi:hypothetical protein